MIKVEDLNFSYDKKTNVLTDINFTVKKNEWVSILGHNGSGKSTLSRLLLGFLKPTSGNIYIDDILLNEDNMYLIRDKIGIIFQNPDNQFVGVDVEHDVAFGLENRCFDNAKMKELVKKWTSFVRMGHALSKAPEELSGGEKQRVAIASVLALDFDIVILDEATSMLDPVGVSEILEILKILKNEYNKTIITITHDINFASNSDRIILLKEGKILLNDVCSNVFLNHDILASSNILLPYDLALKQEFNNDKELVDLLCKYRFKM